MPSLEDPFVAETLVACLKAFVSLASKHLHYIGTTWTHTLEQWVDLAKEVLDHPPGQAAAYAKVLGAAVKVVCLSSAVEPKGKKGKGRKGKAKSENATLTKMFEIALRCLRDHNEGNRVLPAEVIRRLLTMLSTRSRKFFKEPAFHFIHSYFPLLRLSAEDAQLVDAQPREFLRKHVETITSLETPMLAAVDDAIGYPISSMTPADLAETQQFLAAFAAKPGATELDRVQALLAYSPLIERLERSLPSEVAVFDQVRAWFAAAYPASSDASSSSLLLFAVIRLLRAFLITDIPTFTAEERQTASLRLIGLLVRDGAPVRRTFACLALATLVDQSAVVDNGDEDEDEDEDELADIPPFVLRNFGATMLEENAPELMVAALNTYDALPFDTTLDYSAVLMQIFANASQSVQAAGFNVLSRWIAIASELFRRAAAAPADSDLEDDLANATDSLIPNILGGFQDLIDNFASAQRLAIAASLRGLFVVGVQAPLINEHFGELLRVVIQAGTPEESDELQEYSAEFFDQTFQHVLRHLEELPELVRLAVAFAPQASLAGVLDTLVPQVVAHSDIISILLGRISAPGLSTYLDRIKEETPSILAHLILHDAVTAGQAVWDQFLESLSEEPRSPNHFLLLLYATRRLKEVSDTPAVQKALSKLESQIAQFQAMEREADCCDNPDCQDGECALHDGDDDEDDDEDSENEDITAPQLEAVGDENPFDFGGTVADQWANTENAFGAEGENTFGDFGGGDFGFTVGECNFEASSDDEKAPQGKGKGKSKGKGGKAKAKAKAKVIDSDEEEEEEEEEDSDDDSDDDDDYADGLDFGAGGLEEFLAQMGGNQGEDEGYDFELDPFLRRNKKLQEL